MLCGEIMQTAGDIKAGEWNFFLRGQAGSMDKERAPKPDKDWLSQVTWNMAIDLSDTQDMFKGIMNDLTKTPVWVELGGQKFAANPPEDESYQAPPPEPADDNLTPSADHVNGHWNKRLNSFQKLMFIKAFKEEFTTLAVNRFVALNLGEPFVESPAVSLADLYRDMNNITPLVFVLSTGSDPMNSFLRFAKDMDYTEKIQSISLGQGQGPVAEKMISSAVKNGDWVFLQNCHLAASWMLSLENIVKDISEKPEDINGEFRLFLSSMPAKHFPVAVLQNSVKVTNEPPKGLRANVRRAFTEMTASYFDEHVLGQDWRRIIFGVCFFHAIILERKKFGPLGWNIPYGFNDSDRECALLNMQMFCADGFIPWDTLIYITGEITYGGRVTDANDQRCLRTILKMFFKPDTLEPEYKYSPSGIYYAPQYDTIVEYRKYIDELPQSDEPEIFGMHDNANTAFQMSETNKMISTILEVQPRVSTGGGGKSNDDIADELAANIAAKLMDKLDIDLAAQEMFQLDEKGRMNSLTTVLKQEVDRFNKLLKVIKISLDQLQKAIKGLVVMSEELETVYNAFLNNQVPELWASAAYPSLKPLGSWVRDLVLRCAFINNWIQHGLPKSFWLSGFFFPQGFLTGSLQNFARKYNLPIDHLSFEFHMVKTERDQEEVTKQMETVKFGEEIALDQEVTSPEDGVLVHGLYMDGFKWDWDAMVCCDQIKGQMHSTLPVMHMEPKMDYVADEALYSAPLYKTALRAGVLSTTGHSTNYVVAVELPSSMPQDYWIAKGAALLCQLSE